MLPLSARFYPGDEELGKKNDDHRPGAKSPWQHRRPSIRKQAVKRLFIGIGILTLLYYFVKNIPTDVRNPTRRPSYSHSSDPDHSLKPETAKPVGKEGSQKPPAEYPEEELDGMPKHSHNGPIKFYKLAETIKAISQTKGFYELNGNVLFAASNLKSAAILLPIACEMATWKRNFVHFAIMGRDDMSMDVLKAVNGVEDGCGVLFHDARPDYSVHSTDFRMEVSVSAGLGHIHTFMHPQAIIVDNSGIEDEFFLRALRDRSTVLDMTLIQLPKHAGQNLLWLARLDSASLKVWNKISIDIIIHAQPAASGSLMRLLTSLSKADYFSSAPPRLTIELPSKVDQPTTRFVESFKWPPSRHDVDSNANQLTLHHRIQQYGLTPEENSLRLMEAFWPANPSTSHVLILSPQVQVSPIFFHYLKYTVLEYKYSKETAPDNLLSISLDLPTTFLNDSAPFTPPNSSIINNITSNFLWQAPNSNAALFFGDKWTELHSFISHSQASRHILPTPPTLNTKQISKTYPSWLEQFLSLARARGYWTLYPNLDSDETLVTIHNDLYQPPEEYSNEINPNTRLAETTDSAAEFAADPAHHLSLHHTEIPLASASLLNLFFPKSTLPSVNDMTLLSWDGDMITRDDLELSAYDFSDVFKIEVGGCEGFGIGSRIQGSADDLFCYDKSNKNGDGETQDDVEEATGNSASPQRDSLESLVKKGHVVSSFAAYPPTATVDGRVEETGLLVDSRVF